MPARVLSKPVIHSATSRAGAAVAIVLMLSAAAGAQTVAGSIQGTVTDSSGAVLPGVTVTLKNLETSATRIVVTNDVGYYQARFLPLGPHSITAELDGFKTVVRQPVTVLLNQTGVVDLRMEPGGVAETVNVTAEAPPVNTVNFEIKGTLDSQQIEDRPSLNQTNFLALAETFAGFQENPTSGQNNPTASSGSSINFNGTGTRGATFQINGVNNDDSSENQNRQGVALATIKEFQVISNGFSAEFGRAYGAVVLVQTKSGTNQFHGEGYGYFQNSDFNARSFYATTKPIDERQQYGATAGFPFVKNKLFGFFSFDRVRNVGNLNYARDFPLPAELGAPRLTRGNDTPANRAFIESVLARFPSVTPNDPRSNRTYATVVARDWPDQDYTGRVDWNRGGGDTVFVRYQWTAQKRQTEEIIIGEQALQDHQQQNVGVTWTHLFGGATVGELRYGLGVRDTNVNIAAGNDTPVIRWSFNPVSGPIVGNAGNFPILRDQTDHQFVYNLSTVLGKHSLKTGTDLRFSALDDRADNFNRGFWTFSTTCGGQTYATSWLAFVDGCVSTYQQAYGPNFLENRLSDYNVYGEDNWRLGPNFTLNLGLRYEYVKAPKELEDRIDYLVGDDKNNVEPRIGFAWSPAFESGFLGRLAGGAGNSSVRGGYGTYHGRIFQSVFSQGGASVRSNPPNAALLTFSNQLNVADPTNGFVFTPGTPTTRVSLTLPDDDLEVPMTHQWNLTLERKIFWDSAVRLSYTGSYSNSMIKYLQDNLPLSPLDGPVTVVDHPFNAPAAGFPDLRGKQITAIAANVACAGTGFFPGITVNAACPVPVPLADNEISQRVPRTNERRPNPLYTTNLLISNAAYLWSNGLQVEWNKRLNAGLQFNASYTWSKAMDTNSEATFVGTGDSNQNGPDKQYSKGYSRFHTPHRFTLSGSYRLPWLTDQTDLAGLVLGGWQVFGVLRLAAGTPFTVISTGVDINFDGFSESRPVLLDNSVLFNSVDNPGTSKEQLPASAFRPLAITDLNAELVGRNTFFVDGTNRIDLGIQKTVSLARGHSLNVRVEAFNAANQVQFGFPGNNVTATTFGVLNTTATAYQPRIIQLALRYRF